MLRVHFFSFFTFKTLQALAAFAPFGILISGRNGQMYSKLLHISISKQGHILEPFSCGYKYVSKIQQFLYQHRLPATSNKTIIMSYLFLLHN